MSRSLMSKGSEGLSARMFIAGCRSLAAVTTICAAMAIPAGCSPNKGSIKGTRPSGDRPRSLDEIVSEINANAARLDRAIWSSSTRVTAHVVDKRKRKHTFNFDGTLLFDRPRNLRIDLRHGLGKPVMQIGSNDTFYWSWIEPEMEQMWWGLHRNVGQSCSGTAGVRPEQMVAALGVGGLPDARDGLIGPRLTKGREFDILSYASSASGDRIVRQYYVDRHPPYQIRLIAFLDESGQKEMSAYLDDFREAWEGGPMIAHTISIFWPKDDGKFTVKMRSAVGRTTEQVSASAFVMPTPAELPASVRQNIEQIDADCN